MSTIFTGPTWCLVLGCFFLIPAAACAFMPHQVAHAMRTAPRDRILGCILSTLAWIGAAWATKEMGLDLIAPYIKYLPFVTIALILLSWFFLKELLTSRAIAGILMTLPMPLILAVRADDSLWRLYPVTLGYIMAIAGMDFMLYPWHHRDILAWLAADVRRLRVMSAVTFTLSVLFFLARTQLSQ